MALRDVIFAEGQNRVRPRQPQGQGQYWAKAYSLSASQLEQAIDHTERLKSAATDEEMREQAAIALRVFRTVRKETV